jgi:hypothetical protein
VFTTISAVSFPLPLRSVLTSSINLRVRWYSIGVPDIRFSFRKIADIKNFPPQNFYIYPLYLNVLLKHSYNIMIHNTHYVEKIFQKIKINKKKALHQ